MKKTKYQTPILKKYGHLPLAEFRREDGVRLFDRIFSPTLENVTATVAPVGTAAVNRGRPYPRWGDYFFFGSEFGMFEDNDYLCVAVGHYAGPKKKTIAFVGKGVCFDSGGMNIKTGNYMKGMKFDKLGALNVLDIALELRKQKNPKHNYIFITPFVENLVSHTALHPDDILTYQVGKKELRVEITNTDAEGRLILADGLLEAQARDADIIIDLATLTGHVSYALGDDVVGVLGNDELLALELMDKFEEHGVDSQWLPIRKAQRDMIKAENRKVADIVNSAKSGKAGCQEGAAFLERFIYKDDVQWIHLDIAGIADKKGKVFTGLVGPIVEFVKGLK